MEARYLRVKNHAKYQHYDPLKRRPPWIKLFNDLLGGESGGFDLLSEEEQWQLVRIWLVASKSTALAYDESDKIVPVVVDDEKSLRRSIMSLKHIPVAKFIREGWLIPVAECELVASTDASNLASTGDSALLGTEEQSFREVELRAFLGGGHGDAEKPLEGSIRNTIDDSLGEVA